MLITINTNNGSGKPVPGAVITFARNGAVFNSVPFPDNTGILYFDSTADAALFTSDVTVRVTAPGYTPAGTTGSNIAAYSEFEFTLKPNGLQTALLVGGGAGLLLAVGAMMQPGKKKRRVSGIDVKNDVLPYVVPAVVVFGGYLVYTKLFGQSPQEKQRDDALNNDIANAGPALLSDSEIAATANALKEDLTYSGVSNNYVDAAHQLTKAGNTADILKIVQAYGKHIITFFGIPTGTYTLEETVTRQMPADYIAEINAYYDAQGINFKF